MSLPDGTVGDAKKPASETCGSASARPDCGGLVARLPTRRTVSPNGPSRVDEKGLPRWLHLPATKTKSAQARAFPIGATLRAELAIRTTGPDGQVHPSTALSSATTAAERVVSIRTAWTLACKRAGILDLHSTTSAASSLADPGVVGRPARRPVVLGHASVTQTSTYLSSTPVRLRRRWLGGSRRQD